MDSEYAQAHATTEQQKQEQAPAHSNIGKQASSSSSSLAKQGNGDLKSLLEKQLATFDSFFENFNKSSFSHLDSLLSNEPAFAWQIRPLSLYPDVFTKSGLEYKKDEVGDLFRQMKEKLLKDIQGKDANDNDFEHSSAMFIDFEPGTNKIVKGVQFFDSTTTHAQAKRFGTKI
ncbi:hypothetical protein JCM3766R1_006653 [Sporobolomyces carnicolor]